MGIASDDELVTLLFNSSTIWSVLTLVSRLLISLLFGWEFDWSKVNSADVIPGG